MAALLNYKDDAPDIIERRAEEGERVRRDFFDMFGEDLQEACKLLALALSSGNKLFLCGTGTSSSVAGMLADRFIGRGPERAALPVIHLQPRREGCSEDTLARRIDALGNDGDVLVIFSADGQSPLLADAARAAHERGIFTLGLTGGDGGMLADDELIDLDLRVPSIEEAIVHEVHVSLAFLVSELTDYYLYTKPEILRNMLQGDACEQDYDD